MSINAPFNPLRGGNVVVSPAAASANTAIGLGHKSIRFTNSGAAICYVRIGFGTQTATTADTPVLAGTSVILSKAQDDDNVAYISASGTTLNIQPGEGGYV